MPTRIARSSSFILTGRVSVSGDAWEGDAEVTVDVGGGIPEFGAFPPVSAPAAIRALALSEDAWEGDVDFVVRINGAAVAMPRVATAPGKCRRNPKLHLHD